MGLDFRAEQGSDSTWCYVAWEKYDIYIEREVYASKNTIEFF